ncbi:putative uncharacterized protein DDB_G0290989 isoform X3 [Wyeomyia smithii]|uniref:putative uncharacterized protein DDB_G0290989 isoform X3 n=1 Tax=Wyeomyia smithii TaxID=174621 RepID=UPI002467D378|nr:putative uncharacterized protein DDB_G0290989 isoform X3 [Wyeomyia smithii]
MANPLSTTKMTNPIRGLVSKRRIRYIQDGFDLDLTYINDRIIAMGYPAEQLESLYRNKIEDVQKMLEKNHAGCYKIYNLCSERNYNHERFPNYSGYPFKDHNPPDIELINSFCEDVDKHLRADSKNVVAVHCKAGKGRTGTMICCYLLYSRQFNTAAEALHYYGQRRTRDSKGVTIPSQRRYVEYYATLLRSSETYRPVTLYICEIRLSHPINVKEGTITVKGQNPVPLPEFKRVDDSLVAKLDYCMPLAGDVKIEFAKSLVLRKEKRCHFWFNTYFVEKLAMKDAESNLLLTFGKSEIDDAHKDKQHKEYPNNFTVTMILRRVPPGKYSDTVSLKKCQYPVSPVTNSPIIKCNLDNSTQQLLVHPQQQSQHQQRLLQQSQGQNHVAHHRQLNSEPYWPSVTNYQNMNCIDGNIKAGVHGAQCNHQAQLSPQQQQVSQTMLQNRRCDTCEEYENNHCLEYSETSSSESSTEEEGWDSGSVINSIRHHHQPITTATSTTTTTSTVPSNSNNNNDSRNKIPATVQRQQQLYHPPHHQQNHTHDGDDDLHGKVPSTNQLASSIVSATSSHEMSSSVSSPLSTSTMKSPIKKSASAVETVVTSAAHKLNSKLRRMSTNAILSFSVHTSGSNNCKSNNKTGANDNGNSSKSSGVNSSTNKCDIFNLMSRSAVNAQYQQQQHQQHQQEHPINGQGSNPSSPVTSPVKVVGRSMSNDPGPVANKTTADQPRRDSLPIIGGLLSSFSSSSVSSSNSSSLSSSTFGTGSVNHGPPALSTLTGNHKHHKLHALFSVSSCYNGSSGRDPDDNDDADNDGCRKGKGGGGGRGSGVGDDDDDDDADDDDGRDIKVVGEGSERRKVGGCGGTSNSDSGRSSTEIVPEANGTTDHVAGSGSENMV